MIEPTPRAVTPRATNPTNGVVVGGTAPDGTSFTNAMTAATTGGNVLTIGGQSPDFDMGSPVAQPSTTGGGGGSPTTTPLPSVTTTPGQPTAGTQTTPATTTTTTTGAGATTPTPGQSGAAVCDMPGHHDATSTATATGGGGSNPIRNVGTNLRGPNTPINVKVGVGASFSFPAPNKSNASVNAPAIKWSSGWTKKTAANGRVFYEHVNGSKAYPGIQPRIGVSKPGKVSIVATQWGRAKKFPDGTILGIDKSGQTFRIDKKGNRHDIALGKYNFGGVKVRVFEAATVGVVTPDGRNMRYDSRGNVRFGRGANQMSVSGGGASAGATQVTGGGPIALSGEMSALVNSLIGMTRNMLEQLEGEADPALIQQAYSILNGLPAAIGQSAGGAAQVTAGGSGTPPATQTTPATETTSTAQAAHDATPHMH